MWENFTVNHSGLQKAVYLSHGANVGYIPGFAGVTERAHKVAAPTFADFFPMHNIKNSNEHIT